MSDIRSYTFDVPQTVELDVDWIIKKTESLAKANPNATFLALVRDAVVFYADLELYFFVPEEVIDDIVDDIFWDRKDEFAKIATKYSKTCTMF